MTPVRLEPVALRSRVKRSTTEPLRSYWPGFASHIILLLDFIEMRSVVAQFVER